jgi:hypothetical protein
LAEEQGRDNGHQRGHRGDRWRVDAGEAVNEPLRRRLPRLRLLHQPHHAAQRVVSGQAGHLHFQRAGGVDSAGEDIVAWLLVYRHALTGDWGLIHTALPGPHDAIHADPVAGPHQHQVADGDLLHRHLSRFAVG